MKRAEECESKVKSENEEKLKKLEKSMLDREIKIKKHFMGKYKNVDKQYEDIKQLEELHRKQKEKHEQQRKIAKLKVAKAAQKIAIFQNEIEVKESAQYCLNEAVTATLEIKDIMISTSNFWRDTETVCKTVAEHNFRAKVSKLNSRSHSSCKSLWGKQNI